MSTTKLFPILLILILLTPLSYALSLDEQPEECQTVDFCKPSNMDKLRICKDVQECNNNSFKCFE